MPDDSESEIHDGTLTRVFRRMSEGDEEAAGQIWQKSFPRLVAIAAKTLKGAGHVVKGPDDAVQSAFINFWQQARRGDYPDLDSSGVMRMLVSITKNKCKKYFRDEHALKRGGGKVVSEGMLASGTDEWGLDQFGEVMPASDFDRFVEEALSDLGEELRLVILMRLIGHTNQEIADRQGWTITKVERKFRRARDELRRELDENE